MSRSSSSPISSGNTITRVYRRYPILGRFSPTSSDTTPVNANSDSETDHANIVETPKRPKIQRKYTKKKEGKAKTAGKNANTKEKIIKRPKATGKKDASVERPQKTKSEDSKNEVTKKITTKDMINHALIELNTRKGVSLYAIKKFIAEKYDVDTEKVNHIIKRQLKIGVEEGRIKQTKGVGASGSFKRVATKGKQAKDKTEQTDEPPAKKSKPKETDKPNIEKKTETKPKTKEEITKSNAKDTKKKEVANVSKTKESEQPTKRSNKSEQPTKKLKKSDKATKNSMRTDVEKKKTVKIKTTNGETNKTAKKTQTARRKSIVKIKPPKMKPKAST